MRARGRGQFPISQILHPAVDAERERPARPGRLNAFNITHDAPVTIDQDPLFTGPATEPAIIGQFQPFLTLIIDPRKTEDVGADIGRRVIALVFRLGPHAPDVESFDSGGQIGMHLALQINGIAAFALVQKTPQRIRRHAQRGRQFRQTRGLCGDLPGADQDGFERRAHRQMLAVAVGDHAAMGRDFNDPHRTRVALCLEKIVIQ